MRGLRIMVLGMLLLLLLPAASMQGSSRENPIPEWKPGWSYQQELQLPIQTNDSLARYQPIDLRITFANPCWTKNVNETSIRVCALHNNVWHELESQIYNLNMISGDIDHVAECNVVFLVPDFADGTERYFIFYNDGATPSPMYVNHVDVIDANYSYSPLPEVSAQARFYGIIEDGFNVYGVGQEGQILDRPSAQVVVKQKIGTKQFDILGSDQIVSFAFSYFNGSKDKDESSSDQVFLSKKILVDGNLMVAFGVMSESKKEDVRTTVIYKYYYCPMNDKRLNVHVKHEMLKNATVQGIDNVDGRFGSIISIKARSASIDSLNFGVIYPYLDFYGMNGDIEEYQMDQNPNTKEREWIVSYKDNADLGKQAWLSYGQGIEGVANAVLFASNEGIVTSGTDERDGIQLKSAEKQYFNFLGTEVDYASLSFGRNSYQPGYYHDVNIPSNLVVQYDAEVFFSNNGGYAAVQNESHFYQALVKSRYFSGEGPFEQVEKRYNLTVITRFGGTHFTHPWLSGRTGTHFPVMWIELYKNGELIAEGATNRSLLIRSSRTFGSVPEGTYLIKVFWKRENRSKTFTGAATLDLNADSKITVFCTWEHAVTLTFKNQYQEGIPGIHVYLRNKNSVLFDENITRNDGSVTLMAPYNAKDPYSVDAEYKNFIVYDQALPKSLRDIKLNVSIDLYELTVKVTDTLHLTPGVEVIPTLLTTMENKTIVLTPENLGDGVYVFHAIPASDYTVQLSYGDTENQLLVTVPTSGDMVQMEFKAEYSLTISLFDSKGNSVDQRGISFKVLRNNQMVFTTNHTEFSLPPAHYCIQAFANGNLIGTKDITLTNTRHLIFVTTLSSLMPSLIIIAMIGLIVAAVLLSLMKKFSLRSTLKCVAFALVIIALLQPWWVFSGSSPSPLAQRDTALYINPGVMVESTTFNGQTSLTIAEMPDIFLAFLGVILPVIILLCVVLISSVILKKIKKRNYSFLLTMVSVIIFVLALYAFYVGIQKLCETSIGSVQGQGDILVMIQGAEVHMQSTWGFGPGYYCMILGAVLAVGAVILESYLMFKMRKQS
jgi:hypothetical protein